MVTCTGHIGIHEGADVRTNVHDVVAIKPNFLTSMGYHILLTIMLRARYKSCPISVVQDPIHIKSNPRFQGDKFSTACVEGNNLPIKWCLEQYSCNRRSGLVAKSFK